MKKLTVLILSVLLALTLAGCREAERVSYNVSKEADNFNVCRQITVINIRDDKVLYTLEGFFSIQNLQRVLMLKVMALITSRNRTSEFGLMQLMTMTTHLRMM